MLAERIELHGVPGQFDGHERQGLMVDLLPGGGGQRGGEQGVVEGRLAGARRRVDQHEPPADAIARRVPEACASLDPPRPDLVAVDELARILKLRTPTAAQTAAMQRVLLVSAGEINMEIDFATDDSLQGWERSLCEQVNLDRAADLWRHTESIPGVLGVLDEGVPLTPGRYSWERYGQRLAPVKRQWGFA
jgi:hypothetical protein